MENKIQKLLKRAKEIDEKATPGPWMWEIRKTCQNCKLMTKHSGQYYVMEFERWGMQSACPSFQVYKQYTGHLDERGSMGMVRSDKLAKAYPGKEHHVGFDDYINHPDAIFIAESRELVSELIETVEKLQNKIVQLEMEKKDG